MRALLEGNGYEVHFVEGDDPARVHQAFAATLDACYAQHPRHPAGGARATAFSERPRWPAIVLRTPKGWTGPKVVDGLPVEGTFRAHQVPLADVRGNPEQLRMLEDWMRSYQPEELFDANGRLIPELAALAPRATGAWAPTRTPTAASCWSTCDLPDFRDYALDGAAAGHRARTSRPASSARCMRDIFAQQRRSRPTSASSAPTRPTPTGSATSSRWRTAASSARPSPSTTTSRPTAG